MAAGRDQAEVKRLERAKSKAEAVSRRHLDELALIRRLQRQKLGVGRKQKLTAQERETKRLLDAKVCAVFLLFPHVLVLLWLIFFKFIFYDEEEVLIGDVFSVVADGLWRRLQVHTSRILTLGRFFFYYFWSP